MLIIAVLLLSASIFFYIPLARYFNIIDKPTARGAHTEVTIRGLGVIFIVAGIMGCIYTQTKEPFFWVGFFLIGGISFWDDIRSLPNKVRIVFHFIAICLLLFQLNQSYTIDWWFAVLLLILLIGIVNAYNFMDGINGITGVYSLVTLGFLYYLLCYQYNLIDEELLLLFGVALVVFLYFNFRKKAIGFGGDVGSITLAYLILYLLLTLILYTKNWKYLFFLGLYGIDTIYTLLYRLSKKENIFKAHKLHFFQLLVHEYKWPHLRVSLLYAILQTIWNFYILNFELSNGYFYTFPILLLIGVHFFRFKKGVALGQY